MIHVKDFYEELLDNQIDFFTGVPDSLLKDFCAYLTDNTNTTNNVIAANEGGAIGLAAGHYLATGKIPLIYMQNSGLGNVVNPLLSLADKEVYSIPMILLIGWRGEPGVKDEPQHVKQGRVTISLLQSMEIDHIIMDENTDFRIEIRNLITKCKLLSRPVAIVIRKNTFESYKLQNKHSDVSEISREDALNLVVSNIPNDSIIVSTTGMLSRELFELREKNGQNHNFDFLTVGSMGHASQIALGIAIAKPERNVFCFDGDGAVLMHLGGLGIIGNIAPKNFKHIVFNNGAHDSVGGQPTVAMNLSIVDIALASNYCFAERVISHENIKTSIRNLTEKSGPGLIEIIVKKGARKDLGRPTSTPIENKSHFMTELCK
jgi:phosphonopyruvate decarboxylase